MKPPDRKELAQLLGFPLWYPDPKAPKPVLNPYVHTCMDDNHGTCDACDWASLYARGGSVGKDWTDGKCK